MQHADIMAASSAEGRLSKTQSGEIAGFGGLLELWRATRRMVDRWHQRQALKALDDRLLKDIGLTQSDVEQEFRKPFWQH